MISSLSAPFPATTYMRGEEETQTHQRQYPTYTDSIVKVVSL